MGLIVRHSMRTALWESNFKSLHKISAERGEDEHEASVVAFSITGPKIIMYFAVDYCKTVLAAV